MVETGEGLPAWHVHVQARHQREDTPRLKAMHAAIICLLIITKRFITECKDFCFKCIIDMERSIHHRRSFSDTNVTGSMLVCVPYSKQGNSYIFTLCFVNCEHIQ